VNRRKLLLAALAVLAIGTAWWLLSDGLTVEERRLVGTWTFKGAPRESPGFQVVFGPDRKYEVRILGLLGDGPSGRWAMEGSTRAPDRRAPLGRVPAGPPAVAIGCPPTGTELSRRTANQDFG
jgi:hypothetical protein